MRRVKVPFDTKNLKQKYYSFENQNERLKLINSAENADLWAVYDSKRSVWCVYAYYQYIDWRERYNWAVNLSHLIKYLKNKSISYELEEHKTCEVTRDNWLMSAYITIAKKDIKQL